MNDRMSHPILESSKRLGEVWFRDFRTGSYRFHELQYEICKFFERGLNGGSISICDVRSGCKAKLEKYIIAKGEIGIKLNIGLEDGSSEIFEIIKDECAKIGRSIHVDPDPTNQSIQNVEIGFGDCVSDAHHSQRHFQCRPPLDFQSN